jgi:hypothetical protein
MTNHIGIDVSNGLYPGSQPLHQPIPTLDWQPKVRLRKAAREMTGEEAFAFASELIQQRNFAAAAATFDVLTRAPGLGSRAGIMLAICKAGLGQHALALAALRRAFEIAEPDLAAAIFKVCFPSRSVLRDAELQELARAVTDHVPAVTRSASRIQRLWR